MDRNQRIETALSDAIDLAHLEVLNESSGHNVPDGSQTHFKVVLVSEMFSGEGLLARHRRVNDLLSAEFEEGLHALAIHTYTPDEWRARHGDAPMSPPCLGGDGGDGRQRNES